MASLLHDDVIDNADTRRGLRALNTLFGNKVGGPLRLAPGLLGQTISFGGTPGWLGPLSLFLALPTSPNLPKALLFVPLEDLPRPCLPHALAYPTPCLPHTGGHPGG